MDENGPEQLWPEIKSIDCVKGDEVIGMGSSCFVVQHPSNQDWVVKRLRWEGFDVRTHQFKAEVCAMRRLGQHPRIVQYIGLENDDEPPNSLIFVYASNGNLAEYLLANKASIPTSQRLRWCMQAAESLAYIHSKGVRHCDLRADNFLLDKNLDLLMCDFGGSSVHGEDGFEGAALPDPGYYDPTEPDKAWDVVTEATEVFGLASVMYYIMMARHPHGPERAIDYDEELVYEKGFADALRAGKPPEVGGAIEAVIHDCWLKKVASAQELIARLQAIEPETVGELGIRGVAVDQAQL